MTDILAEICATKRQHVARQSRLTDPLAMRRAAETRLRQDPPRGFADRLAERIAASGIGLIAEIKKASPSHGLIRPDFDPAAHARAYAEGGAACLSVLTDRPYFQGEDSDIALVRQAVPLPILRKDFMLDPYQIAESCALGADCVLLIMAALTDGEARLLAQAARDFGLDILVECHDAEEIDRALALPGRMIGINNRDLKSLKTDLAVSETLAPRISADRLIVAESGLRSFADLERLARVGVRACLVGESLMRERDLAQATRKLLGADAPLPVRNSRS